MIHRLKTWPEYYEKILTGEKTFEYRVNDRNFAVGDTLELEEYDPHNGYTGRAITRHVSYIYPLGSHAILALQEKGGIHENTFDL
jgi:Domain of unknown function (DUF3850)